VVLHIIHIAAHKPPIQHRYCFGLIIPSYENKLVVDVSRLDVSACIAAEQ
jgi:hypothetical protein